MPPFGAISRRDLVRFLKNAGFDGPYPPSPKSRITRKRSRNKDVSFCPH